MKRNSQISMFMVLGVILLFIIGLGFYFISNIKSDEIEFINEESIQLPIEFQPLQSYVSTCLKDSSLTSVYDLGLQGGYYSTPFEFLYTDYALFAYYYKNKNIIPTKFQIENELSDSISDKVNTCLNFSIFKNQYQIVSNKTISAKASILDKNVIVNLDLSLTLKRGDTTQEFSSLSYNIPVRLGHIYDISKELTNKITKEPYYTDLTYLLEQDVEISVIHFDECNDIYLIVDNYSKTTFSDNYLYVFSAKIEDKYCKFEAEVTQDLKTASKENTPPILDLINYSTIYANQNFLYKVQAMDLEDDKLFFIDDTDLFHIHPLLGLINFTPKSEQIGLHKINITAVDINGAYESQWFYLDIK